MSKWLLAVSMVFLGGLVAVDDAEARRLGGGRSLGVQRNVTVAPKTPAQKAQAQPEQKVQAPQSGSRWGGLLGGLALGGLLGALFAGNGLLALAAIAALALVAAALISTMLRRAGSEAQPIQFAGFGNETVAAPPPSQVQGLPADVLVAPSLPPGFDRSGFLRAAKTNFIRLQAANDSGRLDEIRELTTNDMFDALRADVLAGGASHTDVVALNADLLELATEQREHRASVRFSGMVRETPGTEPVGFEEVWNLVKPADGSSGWLLAGIQQMH
ncbi:MAG TPA: Tim44-like domain-containing protein [Burkholderiales bacterium]|nr:Tim44-like domain-containing protein [Burkholderiales bacterium]